MKKKRRERDLTGQQAVRKDYHACYPIEGVA